MSTNDSKFTPDEKQDLKQETTIPTAEAGDGQAPDPVQVAQEQADKFKNEYLYLRAEFENYKRNTLKERSDLLKFGAERVIRDLLSVMDNFDRALGTQVTAETYQNFVQGVELTAKQIRDVLQKNGVQEVASDGLAFDPMVHEALGSEPTTEVPEGHVSKTFAKAYKLHDRVIRPAQVIVARKP